MQVVAGSGAIQHKDLVDLSSKAFANLPSTPTTASDLVEQVQFFEMCAPHQDWSTS